MNRLHMTLGIVTVGRIVGRLRKHQCRLADKMKQQAVTVEDISKQWKQGNELRRPWWRRSKAKGNELVAEGQKQIAEGDNLDFPRQDADVGKRERVPRHQPEGYQPCQPGEISTGPGRALNRCSWGIWLVASALLVNRLAGDHATYIQYRGPNSHQDL